jgi:RNA polymerase sigma-70 factor (ECF subfamily)
MKNDTTHLLQRARSFNQNALAEIYDQFSPAIFAYAVRLTGNQELAEECVAEVFSRLLRALKTGQGPTDHLQAYLYRIAHNWLTDLFRRQAPPLEIREDFPAGEADQPEPTAQVRMQQQAVRSALRRLTPEQCQVILLRFYQQCSIEDTAAAMQKEETAVKALQHRAMQALKKILRIEDEDEG